MLQYFLGKKNTQKLKTYAKTITWQKFNFLDILVHIRSKALLCKSSAAHWISTDCLRPQSQLSLWIWDNLKIHPMWHYGSHQIYYMVPLSVVRHVPFSHKTFSNCVCHTRKGWPLRGKGRCMHTCNCTGAMRFSIWGNITLSIVKNWMSAYITQ